MNEPLADAIDRWLHTAPGELADAGFTAAVMRRVADEEARRHPGVDGQVALVRLRQRAVEERRSARWRLAGATLGAVLAAGVAYAIGKVPTEMALPQALALMAGMAAAAWWLTDGAAAHSA